MRQNRAIAFAVCALLGVAAAASVQAQASSDDDSLGVTMTLLPEQATQPDAITKTITLPPSASAQAVTSSAAGLARANGARQRRETALQSAAEARGRAREFGKDMAEQAQENREAAARGRSDDLPPRPEPPDRAPPDARP